jgi:hypothetical protein
MDSVDREILSSSIESRAKALSILRSARRPSLWVSIASTAFTIVVLGAITIFSVDGQLPTWLCAVILGLCISAVTTTIEFSRSQRQLLAVIDLILLNEDQKS